ncbi:MAG: LysR family transcriptional regulator [Synechococcales cyanobacterium]
MDRLAWMHSFMRVVETGSFSAVAREQQTTQPSVSKQIAALEAYLDVQLLTRSTRRLHVTEAGERFYEQCQTALAAVAQAEASVGYRQQPSGTLRVNCPLAFGQYHVLPYVPGFLQLYPQLALDLSFNDHFANVVEDGSDLAIRIGLVRDSMLVTYVLGMTRRITVAAATYFQQAPPPPQTPEDLTQHNCLIHSRSTTGHEWHFRHPVQGAMTVVVNGNLRVDSSLAMREAVLAGLGIAICPVWLLGDCLSSGGLVTLLEDYQPPPLPIQAVYRRGRYLPAKVRCFIDYLSQHYRQNPWLVPP